MITIIQATNRPDSNTEYISRLVQDMVTAAYSGHVGYVSMTELPPEILFCDPYEESSMPKKLIAIQDQLMIPASHFIWIIPEYNGSFPGVVKLFIDALSVRSYEETFQFKKSAIIGITSGRSGNIRGMDHLASILMHMKCIIYPRMLPISRILEQIDDRGQLTSDQTMKTLDAHVRGFLEFYTTPILH